MVVQQGRTRLDTALANPELTVLILSGPKESKAGTTHQAIASREWEPWRRYFLVTDLALLTDMEKAKWFGGDRTDRYAVVGGSNQPKAVGKKGPIRDLLRNNGALSTLKVRLAFAKGDQL